MAAQISAPTNLNATPRGISTAIRPRLHQVSSQRTSRDTIFSNPDLPASPSSQGALQSWLHDPSKLSVASSQPPEQGESHSSPRQSSFRSSGGHQKDARNFVSFLTLKEPSTAALDEYAEQQNRQAAKRGGRIPGARGPTNASQKLPHHVPKVNSKWDGLPDRGQRDPGTQPIARSSTISSTSRGSGWTGGSDESNGLATRRRYGSLSSRPAALQPRFSSSERLKHAYGQSKSAAPDTPNHDPAENFSPPAVMNHRPPKHRKSRRKSDDRGKTFLLPPSPPPRLPTHPSPRSSSNVPSLQEYDTGDRNPTPLDGSPPTPAADAVSESSPLSDPAHSPLHWAEHHSLTDPTGTFWISDSEDVTVKLAGLDVLKPPSPVTNRAAHPSTLPPNDPDKLSTLTEDEVPEFADWQIYQNDHNVGFNFVDERSVSDRIRNFSHVSKYHLRTSSSMSGISAITGPASPPQSPSYSVFPKVRTNANRVSFAPTTKEEENLPLSTRSADNLLSTDRPKELMQPELAPPAHRRGLRGQASADPVVPWDHPKYQVMAKTQERYRSTKTSDSGRFKRWGNLLSRS